MSILTDNILEADAIGCLRLLLLQRADFIPIGGLAALTKLLREASRSHPEEAVYCLSLLPTLHSKGMQMVPSLCDDP